ncbi:MAG: ComF family protein [Clostridiales bacterium]|nr:ComF family protein [Clostridiales bacterium]
MGNKLKQFFNKVLDIMYPKGLACISCQRELDDHEREYALCKKCHGLLTPVESHTKIIIGTKVFSCFEYDKVARQFVLSYKDSEKPYIAEYIAKFIKDKYIEKNLDLDGIVFVPSSLKKISKRGYDALKIVAKHLSSMLDIPILYGLSKKNVATDLTEVPKEKRAKAVEDMFFVAKDNNLKDKKVLIIDDVITTGATLNKCVKELQNVGVKEVTAITFSKAYHQ